jgi:hypothetical protein
MISSRRLKGRWGPRGPLFSRCGREERAGSSKLQARLEPEPWRWRWRFALLKISKATGRRFTAWPLGSGLWGGFRHLSGGGRWYFRSFSASLSAFGRGGGALGRSGLPAAGGFPTDFGPASRHWSAPPCIARLAFVVDLGRLGYFV